MRSIELKAPAKINLSLDVLGKMDNGYHEMRMIMQSVDLCDDISVTVIEGSNEISAASDKAYLPTGMDNLACKAAKAFLITAGIKSAGVKIEMKKQIPVCAGLGGGSSDAAAVLRGLNELFDTGFDASRLEEIAKSVGSDVPYCVSGGTMLAEGLGDKLTPLSDLPDCNVLICKPRFSVSTPELFSKIDCCRIRQHPDTDGILDSLSTQNLRETARRLYNVFEDVLPLRERRTVDSIKNIMLTHGALGACMTGTGSAVFSIFDNEEKANTAKTVICSDFECCFLAKPCKKVL